MRIDDFVDNQLVEILDKYSDESSKLGSSLKQTIKNSEGAEMIIPILGVQGTGKSTLINGLLKENILPNEADETTCVPVEVKYGENEKADVFFFGKSDVVVVNTREELGEYVDNNYNPANRKGVERIVLYRQNPLLKTGMTIVDLPGVGSLTLENENTTKRYIENLCAAVFVLPTNPPFTKTQAMFIKAVWSQFPQAVFVQNDWGETEMEKAECLDYKRINLRNIAKELHTSFDDEDLVVVNAYKSIRGALEQNKVMLQESNISSLVDKLDHISLNWETEKRNALLTKVGMCLLGTKQTIQDRIHEQSLSAEEVVKKRKAEHDDYVKGTRLIGEKLDGVRRLLSDKEDEIFQLSKTKSAECAGLIRAKIYQVIESGVVDGSKLAEAFEHIQEDEMKSFFDAIFGKMMETKYAIEEKFSEIQDVFNSENDFRQESIAFDKKSAFKFEKAFGPVSSIGGALAIGAFSGPWGWVAAAGILIIGSIGKQLVMKGRMNDAKKEIAPIIDDIENELRKTVREKFEAVSDKVKKAMEDIMSERRKEERRLYSIIREPVNSEAVETLTKDLEYVEHKINELNHDGK